MPSLKKQVFKICPKFMIKPAIAAVNRYREVRGKIETILLFPNKTNAYCPCCGTKCKAFIAGSYADYPERFNPKRYEKTRQDVLCPLCRALPRHRIFAAWCEKNKELFKNADILYFAPEYSMTIWMKKNHVSFTSADLFKEADLKLDIQATGLPEFSYDIIIANHVLEHVDDFQKALKEVYRILKPAGCFICSFPIDPKIELLDEEEEPLAPEERLRRFGQNDHKRVFGMNAEQFLTVARFKVETIRGEDYSKEILPIVGPADYDMNILFRCIKE